MMTYDELYKRQISHKGTDVMDALPEGDAIAVVYCTYDDVFVFDSRGLDEQGKTDLVNALMNELQEGTAYTRDIIKVIGNIYFVY